MNVHKLMSLDVLPQCALPLCFAQTLCQLRDAGSVVLAFSETGGAKKYLEIFVHGEKSRWVLLLENCVTAGVVWETPHNHSSGQISLQACFSVLLVQALAATLHSLHLQTVLR